MQKKYDRDVFFLFKALLAAALVLALLRTAFFFMTPADPEAERIAAATRQIVPLRASEVPSLLRAMDGKPTMLVVYASWCPYCKLEMPYITDSVRNHRLDNVHPLFISVDANFTALAAYVVHNQYSDVFTPYVAKQSGVNSLAKALKKSGSGFTGTIPYIGFFDSQGKMVAEFNGVVDKERLLETAGQFTR